MMGHLPEVVDYYLHLKTRISELVGEPVHPTSLDLPTSCALITYDQAGDGIQWHYDVNYFNGRFFTVLIPVTLNDTCTQFQYRDSAGGVVALNNKAEVFEGDLVYHRATQLCEGQYRVILSLQYSTDPGVSVANKALMWLKDRAFVGSGY
jgi:hypothetical protein